MADVDSPRPKNPGSDEPRLALFKNLLALGDFVQLRAAFSRPEALPPPSDLRRAIEEAAARADGRAISGLVSKHGCGWGARNLERICPGIANRLLGAAQGEKPETLADAFAALLASGLLRLDGYQGLPVDPGSSPELAALLAVAGDEDTLLGTPAWELELTRRLLAAFGLPPQTREFAIERDGELSVFRVVNGRIELARRQPTRTEQERRQAAEELAAPVAHSDRNRRRIREGSLLGLTSSAAGAEAAAQMPYSAIRQGALSSRDAWGRPVLQLMAIRGGVSLMQWLLGAGADASARDAHGHVAHQLAHHNGHHEAAELLHDAARGAESLALVGEREQVPAEGREASDQAQDAERESASTREDGDSAWQEGAQQQEQTEREALDAAREEASQGMDGMDAADAGYASEGASMGGMSAGGDGGGGGGGMSM